MGAEDTAFGAILEIPQSALDKIKEADDKIKALAQTSQKAANEIKQHWQTIAVEGMDAFIAKINAANTALSGIKMPTGLSSFKMPEIAGSVDSAAITTTAAAVTTLAEALAKLTSEKSKATSSKKTKIAEEESVTQYQALTKELAAQTTRYVELSKAVADYNAKKKEDRTWKDKVTNRTNLAELESLRKSTAILREKLTIMEQLKRSAADANNADLATRRSNEALAEMRKFYQEQQRAAAAAEKARQKEIDSYPKLLKQIDDATAAKKRYYEAYTSGKLDVFGQQKMLDAYRAANVELNALLAQQSEMRRKYGTQLQNAENKHIQKQADAEIRAAQKAESEKTKIAEEQARRRAQIQSKWDTSRTISRGVATYNGREARTLQELTTAYNNLRSAMSRIDPKSEQWAKANIVLQQTKTRIDGIRTAMGDVQRGGERITRTLSQLKNYAAAAFSVATITGYIKKMVEVRAQFEMQQVALRAILQNKDEADRIFMQVQQMALQSPFSILQLTTYTKQLAAYRIEANKLVGTTKMLADVSAGLGVDIARLILAFGQVKSANYLRACLSGDCDVLMYDLSYKKAKDIAVGDMLMGDDERPRFVSRLYQGEQMMYCVRYDGGEYRCNEHHILTAYDALTMRVVDVCVLDYLKEPHRYQGVRRVNGQFKTFPMKVECDKVDTYFGFSIDSNRRFIIKDNIVTHNTEVRQFTEAGLNIAGELANYFSEMKGYAVSVGDVMDMITKRMVRFEDVEEVFKRVTSAGGLFYDMQRKQSETIQGQLQRITDAYSIMFNEIGKSNQGAITAVLSSIRSMIQHWQTLANVMYGVGAAYTAYTIKTIIAAKASGTFAASQSVVVKSLIATRAALAKLNVFLAKNPYVIVAAGVVAVGAALLDWKKKIDAVKESYDNMITSMATRQSELNSIVGKIAETNKRLVETSNAVKGAKKGTEEYSKATLDNKEAISEQYRALQELRTKFPEVYAQIKQAKDGTVEFTNAIKEFAEASRMASVITTLTGEDAGFFNDDFKTDMVQVSAAQEAYNAHLAKTEAYMNTLFAKASALYETRKAEGTLSEKEENRYKELLAIRDSTLTTEQKIAAVYKNGQGWGKTLRAETYNFQQQVKDIYDTLSGYAPKLSSAMAEAEAETEKMLDRILVAAGVTSKEAFKDLQPETKRAAELAGQHVVQSLGLALDEVQRDILSRKLEIPLGIRVTPQETEAELGWLRKRINNYIKSHPEVEMPLITSTEDTDTYFKTLTSNREQDLKEQKQFTKASVQLAEGKANKEMALERERRAEARKLMMDAFGLEEKTKQERGSGTDPWQKRVSLLKEMNTEYEKLLKYYDSELAKQKIQESYAQAVAEAFEGVIANGKDLSNIKVWYGFDKQGMIDELQNILESGLTLKPNKRAELNKMLAGLKAEVDIEFEVKQKAEMQKKIDALFADYNLGEEFAKLGLPRELTHLFGRDTYQNLAEVRKELQGIKEDFAAAGKWGTDKEEAYKSALKKLTEMERKNQEERAKNYYKYLLESYSKGAQIQLKAQQEVNKIMASEQYDEWTKLEAKRNIMLKAQADQQKQMLQEFQGSDLYVDIFTDLKSASEENLNYVIEKLREFKDTFKDMPADQVRAIIKQIESAETALSEKNLFGDFSSNVRDMIKYFKTRKQLEANLRTEITKQANIRKQRDEESVKLDELTKYRDTLKKGTTEWIVANTAVQEQQNLINGLNKDLKESEDKAKGYADSLSKGQRATLAVRGALKGFRENMGVVSDVLGGVFGGLDSMGLVSDGMRDAFDSLQDVMAGLDTTVAGLESIDITKPMSIITGLAQAVGGVFQTIGGLFGMTDKKKERQIKRLREKVEDLDRAYQKLENTMERVYAFEDYVYGSKQLERNLREQLRSYEQMLELEKSKKKSDTATIREFEDAIEDLKKQLQDLADERTQALGGIGKNEWAEAAEDFMGVWYDAFKEQGDGLDALNDKWDDYLKNLIVKQATMRIVSKRLSGLFAMVDRAVSATSDQGEKLTRAELDELNKKRLEIMAALNGELKDLMEAWGIAGGQGELLLSDLQKGISNITEAQAAAIEAYLNSIRFAVYEHTNQLNQMLELLRAQYGANDNSPILTELRNIKNILSTISENLNSVITYDNGQRKLRVR